MAPVLLMTAALLALWRIQHRRLWTHARWSEDGPSTGLQLPCSFQPLSMAAAAPSGLCCFWKKPRLTASIISSAEGLNIILACCSDSQNTKMTHLAHDQDVTAATNQKSKQPCGCQSSVPMAGVTRTSCRTDSPCLGVRDPMPTLASRLAMVAS